MYGLVPESLLKGECCFLTIIEVRYKFIDGAIPSKRMEHLEQQQIVRQTTMHGRLIFGNVERGDHPLEEAFFKTISQPLEDFARHHSLIIWKYPRHAPQWTFHFLHPLGGFASITLNCDSVAKPPRIQVLIQGHWYVDDHEQAIRRVSSRATLREVPPVSEQIVAGLEDILSTVVAWPRSVLTVSPLDVSPQEVANSKVLRSEFELSLRLPT